jgi:hypothetical protein
MTTNPDETQKQLISFLPLLFGEVFNDKNKNKAGKVQIMPLGNRKAVHIYTLEDGTFTLQFTSPIQRDDMRDGEPLPRAYAKRHKNQIQTFVRLSQDTVLALYNMLDEQFGTKHCRFCRLKAAKNRIMENIQFCIKSLHSLSQKK